MNLPSLRGRQPGIQWAALLILSCILIPLLEKAALPAAPMLGCLAAAIVVAAADGAVRVPGSALFAAEALIGCLIARAFKLPMPAEILRDWPLFLGAVVSVLAVSSALGWLLMRWQVLPGTAAIWGSFPGASTVMTLMAEAYGEDVRLVAFMQYLRVALIAVVASLVARVFMGSGGAVLHIVWFPSVDWGWCSVTVAVAAVGAVIGPRLPIPVGALLLPMIGGAILQDIGLLKIELPPWLLAPSYAVIGWSIGLRFTRPILVHVWRAFPRVLASNLTLLALCAGIGAVLAAATGIDPLTAYLAMSPGGVDSVAIIAAGSKVDVPFVVAMQTARFVAVLLLGPSLARFMARRAGITTVGES
ncbi:MAG: AbrB family transcriptional regulator [Steroidobacteraceae bacterium]